MEKRKRIERLYCVSLCCVALLLLFTISSTFTMEIEDDRATEADHRSEMQSPFIEMLNQLMLEQAIEDSLVSPSCDSPASEESKLDHSFYTLKRSDEDYGYYRSLYIAISKANVSEVRELLKRKKPLNKLFEKRLPILWQAARIASYMWGKNEVEILKLLIEHAPDLNPINRLTRFNPKNRDRSSLIQTLLSEDLKKIGVHRFKILLLLFEKLLKPFKEESLPRRTYVDVQRIIPVLRSQLRAEVHGATPPELLHVWNIPLSEIERLRQRTRAKVLTHPSNSLTRATHDVAMTSRATPTSLETYSPPNEEGSSARPTLSREDKKIYGEFYFAIWDLRVSAVAEYLDRGLNPDIPHPSLGTPAIFEAVYRAIRHDNIEQSKKIISLLMQNTENPNPVCPRENLSVLQMLMSEHERFAGRYRFHVLVTVIEHLIPRQHELSLQTRRECNGITRILSLRLQRELRGEEPEDLVIALGIQPEAYEGLLREFEENRHARTSNLAELFRSLSFTEPTSSTLDHLEDATIHPLFTDSEGRSTPGISPDQLEETLRAVENNESTSSSGNPFPLDAEELREHITAVFLSLGNFPDSGTK